MTERDGWGEEGRRAEKFSWNPSGACMHLVGSVSSSMSNIFLNFWHYSGKQYKPSSYYLRPHLVVNRALDVNNIISTNVNCYKDNKTGCCDKTGESGSCDM